MNTRYVTDVFTGLDLRTIAVTLTVSCFIYGIGWALWQFVSWIKNFILVVRIMQMDVNRLLRSIAQINADKLHERLNPRSVRLPTVPPPPVKIPQGPPTLPPSISTAPTPQAFDWADDDQRPSADTVIKSS